MTIRVVEWLGGVLEGMNLTALMGYRRLDKGDGAADGFFAIGDHPFDRDFQLVQLPLDFGE